METQTELLNFLKRRLYRRLFLKRNLTDNEGEILRYLEREDCVKEEFLSDYTPKISK